MKIFPSLILEGSIFIPKSRQWSIRLDLVWLQFRAHDLEMNLSATSSSTLPSLTSSSSSSSSSSTSWFSGIVRGRSDRSGSVKMVNNSATVGDAAGPVVRKNQFRGALFKYGPNPIQVRYFLLCLFTFCGAKIESWNFGFDLNCRWFSLNTLVLGFFSIESSPASYLVALFTFIEMCVN